MLIFFWCVVFLLVFVLFVGSVVAFSLVKHYVPYILDGVRAYLPTYLPTFLPLQNVEGTKVS